MRRAATLHVRLTDDELAAMKAAASAAGHSSLSSWLRCLAYEGAACGASGRELATALVAVRVDLGRIGNNVNQIARVMNQGGEPEPATLDALNQLLKTTADLSGMLNAVRPTVPLA